MTTIWEHSQADGSARLLLLAIADHANDDGTGAWPSVASLAQKTHISERNVQRLCRTLADLGELDVHVGAGPHGSNAYVVKCHPSTENVTPDNLSPLTKATDGGAPGVTRGVRPVSPKPSYNRPEESSSSAPSEPVEKKKAGLAKLVDAFDEAGLTRPRLEGAEARCAASLLREFPADTIVEKWRQIEAGELGDDWLRANLSFNALLGNNRLSNLIRNPTVTGRTFSQNGGRGTVRAAAGTPGYEHVETPFDVYYLRDGLKPPDATHADWHYPDGEGG